MKDPDSFKLTGIYYSDNPSRLVLDVSGTNGYGGKTSSYWLYTYDGDEKEFKLFTTLTDLDEEEYSYYYDSEEKLEKLLKNAAREVVKDIISDKKCKLPSSAHKRINKLFENDELEDIKLLDVKFYSANTEDV